jgi:hypothetical protein
VSEWQPYNDSWWSVRKFQNKSLENETIEYQEQQHSDHYLFQIGATGQDGSQHGIIYLAIVMQREL